jgi:hypothetical protein
MRRWWVERRLGCFRLRHTRPPGRCHDSLAVEHVTASSILLVSARWCKPLITALVIGALSTARAGERIESIYWAGERPAGLYTAVSQFKPAVCQPVLDSLNKAFSIGKERRADYPGFTSQPDLFLASDLELPWTLKLVGSPDAPEVALERLEYAPANIGGRTVFLYRRTFEVRNTAFGDLSVNRLIISNMPLPSSPADHRLDPKILKGIPGQEISLDNEKLEAANSAENVAMPSGKRSANAYFLLNAVAVAGQPFVLAINAAEAGNAAPREIDGSVNLYVLQLHSAANMHLVCHFLGR